MSVTIQTGNSVTVQSGNRVLISAPGPQGEAGSSISDGDKGDIIVSASGATWTVDNDAVTYAKMQNVSAASRLLGRGSASGAGDVQELTLGNGMILSGTALSANVPPPPAIGELGVGYAVIDPVAGNDTTADGTPALPYATAQAAHDDGFVAFYCRNGNAGTIVPTVEGLFIYGEGPNDFYNTSAFDNSTTPRSQITIVSDSADHRHIFSDKKVRINIGNSTPLQNSPDFMLFNAVVGDVTTVGYTAPGNPGDPPTNGVGAGWLELYDSIVVGNISMTGGNGNTGTEDPLGEAGPGGVVYARHTITGGNITLTNGSGGSLPNSPALLDATNCIIQELPTIDNDNAIYRHCTVAGVEKSENLEAGLDSSNTTATRGSIFAERSAVATLTNKSISASQINSGSLAVENGGTGATTLTANNVLLGNGTSAVQVVAPSTSGNVLTSNGTTWTSAAASGATYATDLQARQGLSTNTAIAPATLWSAVHDSLFTADFSRFISTSVTGSGSMITTGGNPFPSTGATANSTARGYWITQAKSGSSAWTVVDYSRPSSFGLTIMVGSSSATSTGILRVWVGTDTNASSIAARGYGFEVRHHRVWIIAHNGTTLVTQDTGTDISSTSFVLNVMRCVNDGAGNISVFMNNAQIGTALSGGPTTAGTGTLNILNLNGANAAANDIRTVAGTFTANVY